MAKKTGNAVETNPGNQPETQVLQNCACGCGEPVVRTFKQGHDQRLVSKLAFDLVEGTGRGLNLLTKQQASLDIQERIDLVAAKVTERLSPALATKVSNAAQLRWALLEKRSARQTKRNNAEVQPARRPAPKRRSRVVEQPAALAAVPDQDYDQEQDHPEPDTNGRALGADVRVQVGRYTYDGKVTGMNQAGRVTAVTYTNKAGNERVIQTPREIKLV